MPINTSGGVCLGPPFDTSLSLVHKLALPFTPKNPKLREARKRESEVGFWGRNQGGILWFKPRSSSRF